MPEFSAAPDGVKFEQTSYDLGAHRWHQTGETLPHSSVARTPADLRVTTS